MTMSTNAPTPATPDATPERVYVKIPQAGPGQGYQAPKNYQNRLLNWVSGLVVVLLCISLPVAPAGIITMILILDATARNTQLWLWIPLGLFVEAIAMLIAIGIGREALGSAGGGRYER
jgi:hypothetical protein